MIMHKGIRIDQTERTISRFNIVTKFGSGNSFEGVCHLILGGGMSKEMLFWHLYSNDPEGGPIAGPPMLAVRMNQWIKRYLRNLRLEIRSERIASVDFYEIVPMEEARTCKGFSYGRTTSIIRPAAKPIPAQP